MFIIEHISIISIFIELHHLAEVFYLTSVGKLKN